MKLLAIEEARARMLDGLAALPAEDTPLDQAFGRGLAADLIAGRDQPPFAASSMDGWAVRRADAQDGPADLRIVGESAAGRGYDNRLGPGEAVRIFTGAVLPAGADWVVIQEEAERLGERVRLGPLSDGANNIRPAGGDFRAGDVLLRAGVRLDPWRLSLAAAAGRGGLPVARRPTVAVLCTGEELVRPPATPGPWQIYESASAALCALIVAWGGEALRLKPARDDQASVIAALEGQNADLIVTVGGASVGDYDVVKPALETLGLQLKVASVNVRPGKPTWFGVMGDGRRVLGLPGNPASAMVCAELFLRPLVLALQGADPAPPVVYARLDEALPANGRREHLMRAALRSGEDGALTVRAFPEQDSGMVGVFARADALLRRPANAPVAPAGAPVQVIRLERL
ncbi:MAG TPA: gephyrin-like molybdotransferase Glp [Caulobacteraceae bacterium]|nr:gephyrin-like molybdotransferase Glp [Caulobacteraceae bacterium]